MSCCYFLRLLCLAFFFLNLNPLIGSEKHSLPFIKHISTNDKRTVKLQFTNKPQYYCVSDVNEVNYSDEHEGFILSLNPPGESYTFTNFKFYEQVSERPIGEITFRLRPDGTNKDEYVTVARTTFPFQKVQDEYQETNVNSLSEEDLERLLKKFQLWNKNALAKISSSKSDIVERCSLIIQFIWSSEPLVEYPPPFVYGLGLLDRLDGLENKEFPLVCGGYASLFTEIVLALMPDVKIRLVHGYECHYPSVYENIHVNSHAFVEVWDNGQWIYIDPFFQLYIKNKKGQLLNSLDVRKIAETGNLKDLVPVRINANPPKNFFVKGKCLAPYNLLNAYGFFKCFGWLRYWDLISI